jgi:CRP-like cAMP-binding protein
MIDIHLRKLRKRDEISAAEEAAIRDAVADIRQVPADKTLIRSGQELNVSTLLLEGWMARAKDLSSGQRQITELHVAGDFVDLHSFSLKRLEHDILTLTSCTVAIIPHEALKAITEKHPHLTRVYWFLTNLDAAIHRERMLSLGARSAIGRIAHLFCELYARLEIVGLTQGRSYELPLTQMELSECHGLTSVHVNRTLQELRRRGVIQLEGGRLEILDLEQLQSIAEFEPAYLYLDRMRRGR